MTILQKGNGNFLWATANFLLPCGHDGGTIVHISNRRNKMAKTATAVIYPAVGYMGSTNVVRVFDKTLEEVRAQGNTPRARFDLAVEVVARFYTGVATPQVEARDIPAALRAPWAIVAAA